MTDVDSFSDIARPGDLAEPLLWVERLPPDATGLLACGDPERPLGGLLIDHGRVCWVAATGLRRRLSDILSEHLSMSDAELRALVNSCRLKNQPLGETLVNLGQLSAGQLKESLLRHSAECLAHLAKAGRGWTWVPRQERGYDPTFTFSANEILFEVGRRRAGPGLITTRTELERICRPQDWVVAFVDDRSHRLPVPLSDAAARLPVATLINLGEWANQTLLAAAAFGDAPRFVLANGAPDQKRDGEPLGTAVWSQGETAFVVKSDQREVLAAMMTRYLSLESQPPEASGQHLLAELGSDLPVPMPSPH